MRLIQIIVILIFVILPIVLVANLFLNDNTSTTISILESEETETNTMTTSMQDSSQTSATTMISTSHGESSTILTKTIVSHDETISYTETKTKSELIEITIHGNVIKGVEAGCIIVDTGDEKYLMLRGVGVETLEIGEWVTVKGYELDEMTTCMEGLPFEISYISSDFDNDPNSSKSSSEIDSTQSTISMVDLNRKSRNPPISWSNLPDCNDDTLFTVPFMKIEDIWYIQPLGNLGPPSHTVPVDHLYFMIHYGDPSPLTNIYAPGDIRIMKITFQDMWIDDVFQFRDYKLDFASCNTRKVSLAHLTTVIPEILETVANTESDMCVSYDLIEVKWKESYKQCSYSISIDVVAGTQIGTTGGPKHANIIKPMSGGLDVTGVDAKAPPSKYINPDRVNYYTDIVCPLNFFAEDARKAQEAKLGDLEAGQLIRRTLEPICGTHIHDIEGTAQGLWWLADYPYSESDNRYALTLAIDNAYPLISIIAAGGQFIDSAGWHFEAKNYGLTNRDFKDVIPDSNIYCYENLLDQPNVSSYSGNLLEGIILIRMIDDLRLSIEYQEDSACEFNLQFIDPYIYER